MILNSSRTTLLQSAIKIEDESGRHTCNHKLIISAKEVMFLPVFCLSVCLCVNKITQKVMDGSF